ncbi:hypothetical protein GCM10022244_21110 [Streptomyces gulbargensis]|uniref:Uncharacterized protein n=1 Tax=Streptomyces gulbargensis TaxID=364901 RepID=A0ABP7M275_9ACTN
MPNRHGADRVGGTPAQGDPYGVVHGFPHRATVHASLTALHRHLSPAELRRYATSVPAAAVALGPGEELHTGVRRVAAALVRHLRLPEARLVVRFRRMEHAASVRPATGPEYAVELNDRFRTRRADIGAALAHELTHVLLHRLGLGFPGTAANEILTDVATTYLGAGWLLLDAYRQDGTEGQQLGYLTPEEFGYVLALRSARFGEDPSPWFTSTVAYEAWVRGRAEAARERRQPPLAGASWTARRRYGAERRLGRAAPGAPYAFDGGAPATHVTFSCPVCRRCLRLPAGRPLRARCPLCGEVLECAT